MKSSGFSFLLVPTIILMLMFVSILLIASDGVHDNDVVVTDPQVVRGDYTDVGEWIEVTHSIVYTNPIKVTITSTYDVREITIDDLTFTADELRNMSGGSVESPVINNSLKNEISGYAKNTFKTLYINGKVTEPIMSVQKADLNLSYVDGDEYDPPITVTATCTVTLGIPCFFTQQEQTYYNVVNLQELTEGCLLMGGSIYSDLVYFSYMGHNTTYVIGNKYYLYGLTDPKYTVEVGCFISIDVLAKPEVSLQDAGGIITITMNNGKATVDLEAEGRMSYVCPDNYGYQNERWNTTAVLDLSDFDALTIADSPVYVHSINLGNIDVGLPQNIRDLEYASADGIRLLYENDIMHVDKIKDYIEGSVKDFEKDLMESLETTDDPGITLEWDWSTITGRDPRYFLTDPPPGNKVMGDERPCVCIVKSKNTMEPGMYDTDLTPYALKGFLHGGARYTFNLNIGLDPNIAADLKLPSDIRLYGETPKATWGDRTTYFFEPMFNGQVIVESSLAPTIDKYKATGHIIADIRNVNIEGTSTVTFDVDINLDGEFFQVDSKNSFIKDYLPEGVTMAFITSDIVRLSIQEGFISSDELMTRMANIIKENLTEFVEGKLILTPTLDTSSVEFDGDIYNMDGSTPLKFNLQGETTYTYGSRSTDTSQLQGAVSITSKVITLKLRGLESWDVTWKVLFPEDLGLKGSPAVAWSDGDVSDLKTGKESGRDYFEITLFNDGKADVEAEIDITLAFIGQQFCVVFVIILIVIVLLIVLVIAFIVVKKRGKKRDEEEERRREEEDMYDRDRRGGSGKGGGRGGRGDYDEPDDYDRGRGRDHDDYDRPRRSGGGRRRGGSGGPLMLMVLIVTLLF